MTASSDKYTSISDGTSRRTELIKVLVVDDNVQFRWALMEALVSLFDFEVVEEASNGFEAVEKARSVRPHVVLMDLQMPDCDGVEATRLLRMEGSEAKVLINTVSEQETDLVRAMEAGARGYVLKNENMEMVEQAIHYVARGGIIVSPAMASKLVGKFNIEPPPLKLSGDSRRLGRNSDLAETVDYDLVIAHPLEPNHVLRLHKWLTEEVAGVIESIVPSLDGDTLVSVTYRGDEPLSSRLASLPIVASMTDESQEPMVALEDSQTPRQRVRLVLQNA